MIIFVKLSDQTMRFIELALKKNSWKKKFGLFVWIEIWGFKDIHGLDFFLLKRKIVLFKQSNSQENCTGELKSNT